MYENHFLKNLLQWLLLARACCFVVMALGRCIARVQSKLQKKHLLQSKKLFFMNISSQRQQKKIIKKMQKAEIYTTRSSCPLFWGSPLCLQRFKYSSIPQLTLFICVSSESGLAFFTSKQ